MSNFDFNRGASKSAADIRAMPFSDRVNYLVEAAISHNRSERDEDEARPYIGASSIGHHCVRYVQFDYLRATKENFRHRPQKHKGKVVKIFDNGHRIEPMVACWLRLAGFEMDLEKPGGGQYGFHWKEANYKGHFDGVIRSSPIAGLAPCLWECKGLKSSVWKRFKKNGVKSESNQYYWQIQANQFESGLTSDCFFTIYNKDTSELHHEQVPHDPEVGLRARHNAMIIHRATERGRLLRRPYSDPGNFKCRDCGWKKACWSFVR